MTGSVSGSLLFWGVLMVVALQLVDQQVWVLQV